MTLLRHDNLCSTSTQWIWDVINKLTLPVGELGPYTLHFPHPINLSFCSAHESEDIIIPLLCESPFSVQFSNSGQNHLETPPLLDLTWVCQAAWDKTVPLVSLYPLMQTPTPRNTPNIRLSMVHILHSFQHLGVWIRRVWYKSSEIMRSVSALIRISESWQPKQGMIWSRTTWSNLRAIHTGAGEVKLRRRKKRRTTTRVEVLDKEEGVRRAKTRRRKIGNLQEKGKEQEKKDKNNEGKLPWRQPASRAFSYGA